MKISEFIEYLTEIQEEHGDLEVKMCMSPYDVKYDMYPVEKEDLNLDSEYGSPTMVYWYSYHQDIRDKEAKLNIE